MSIFEDDGQGHKRRDQMGLKDITNGGTTSCIVAFFQFANDIIFSSYEKDVTKSCLLPVRMVNGWDKNCEISFMST